jgi:hypothetical protein
MNATNIKSDLLKLTFLCYLYYVINTRQQKLIQSSFRKVGKY